MAITLPLSDQDVMTVPEFARIFKVSEASVRRAIRSGDLPGEQVTPGNYRVFVAATRIHPLEPAGAEGGE